MEELNYPLAYAPMPIDYKDEDGMDIRIGYIPNLCYVVGLKRKFKSNGTYKSKYEVVFVDKIVDFENKKIETDIPRYERTNLSKYCCNFEYTDDISFDYDEMKKICKGKNQYLYSVKIFTFDEKKRYLDILNEHEKLLLKKHGNSYDYKTLYYKMKRRDAKI